MQEDVTEYPCSESVTLPVLDCTGDTCRSPSENSGTRYSQPH